MPIFEYKGINANGQSVTGTMEAPVSGAVFDQLDKQNITPVKISIKKEGFSFNTSLFKKKSKIKDIEITQFTKQLVTLMQAGVPIISSLDALVEQTDNPEFKTILQQIHKDVEEGTNFSDALKKHPTAFNEAYTSSVKAGETGGVLDQVLQRVGMLMAYEADIKQKVKGAIRYPIFVITGIGIAFIILMTVVVPKFIPIIVEQGNEIPLPTKIMIGISDFFIGYWWLLILIGIGLFIAVPIYIATPKGRYKYDSLKLKIPVFGNLFLKSYMSRFAHMFETLNKSGLPILQTMEIVSTTIGNKVISKGLDHVGQGIEKGKGISVPLKESGLFPPLVIRMIAVGEQSGSLDEMLHNVAEHYDNEVNYLIENLVSMIEPILTITIGAMVLFLALSIFLPIWSNMGQMPG